MQKFEKKKSVAKRLNVMGKFLIGCLLRHSQYKFVLMHMESHKRLREDQLRDGHDPGGRAV